MRVVPPVLRAPDAALPLQALTAPVSGSAAVAASTDRRLCRPGMAPPEAPACPNGHDLFESRESSTPHNKRSRDRSEENKAVKRSYGLFQARRVMPAGSSLAP